MQVTVSESSSPVRSIFTRQPDNPSVIVADGYGVKISVDRGHLMVEDGIGRARRTRRIPRVDATKPARSSSGDSHVSRLIILSDTGFVTLEALRWCADLGVSVTQLDHTGRILMSSPGLAGDARLRAAQVHAADTGAGKTLVRGLIQAKVSGQSRVLRDVFACDMLAAALDSYAARIAVSESLPEILAIEGQAASAYWRAWKGHVFVPFSPTDLHMVPSHWYSFQGRASKRNPLLQGKNATDPVNAALNFSYALCVSEARYACHVIGLDPALGFGHTAHKGTDTLVHDLMEALRPEADRVVLSMLDTGQGIPYANGKPAYFKVQWFCETRDAVCRLAAPLTHMLAEQVPAAVARLAGDHAQAIARYLSEGARYKLRTPSYAHQAAPARLRVTKPATIAKDLTPLDILPDTAWDAVKGMIPPEPVAPRHKFDRSDTRAVLAGVLCHEIAGVSWRSVPPGFGVAGETCRRRLAEWQAADAWDDILSVIRRSARDPRQVPGLHSVASLP